MLPQEGAGGCWPRPRKDRLASAMTAAATVRLDWISRGGTMLGKMWRPATRTSGKQRARGHAHWGAAGGARRLHVLLGLQRQHGPAGQAQEGRQCRDADGDHRVG